MDIECMIINIEQRENEDFIACFYEADIYGDGSSIPEAIKDLSNAIINQYESLIKAEKKYELGKMPKR